jgi:hypothetical protein
MNYCKLKLTFYRNSLIISFMSVFLEKNKFWRYFNPPKAS